MDREKCECGRRWRTKPETMEGPVVCRTCFGKGLPDWDKTELRDKSKKVYANGNKSKRTKTY